jgi:hypothetical protein
MKKYFHSIFILLLVTVVLACLPQAVTMTLEKAGYFGPRMIKKGGDPLPGLQHPGAVTSSFDSQRDHGLEDGFGVPLVWHEESGALLVAANGAGLD